MKQFQVPAILCGLALCLSSCKKDSQPPADPRDAFVGTYQVNVTGDCFQGTGTLQVKKGAGANELRFTDPGKSDYEVDLNGSSFDIPTYSQTDSGGTYEVHGSGSFGTNSIKYTEITDYGPWSPPCTAVVVGTK